MMCLRVKNHWRHRAGTGNGAPRGEAGVEGKRGRVGGRRNIVVFASR